MERFVRPLPLITPTVKVPESSPSALPIATAQSPIRTSSESPRGTIGRSSGASILMTATSVLGSAPMTFALNLRLSFRTTVMSEASRITWLFVRIRPSFVKMNPEPLLGTRCCARGRCCCCCCWLGWSGKRRLKKSPYGPSKLYWGLLVPSTFRLVSIVTTAGSVLSAICVKGLSRDVTAGVDASRAWDVGGKFRFPERMNPMTMPMIRIPPARTSTFAARMVSFDSMFLTTSVLTCVSGTRGWLLGFCRARTLDPRPHGSQLLFLRGDQPFDRLNEGPEAKRLGIPGQTLELLLLPQRGRALAQVGLGPPAVPAERDEIHLEHSRANGPLRLLARLPGGRAKLVLNSIPEA